MNSAIVWRGISLLDEKTPIVVVLTGLEGGSRNRKTGRVVQAHILVDKANPADVARTSSAVCGDCPRRPTKEQGTTCYVSLARGYPQMGAKLIAGTYPELTRNEANRAVTGRFIRIGAYGDPAAVPVELWCALVIDAAGWTAYTHQWRKAPWLSEFAMASVESTAEREEAKSLGWRTFRILPARWPAVTLAHSEITCPASIEAGKKTVCADCRLCSGLASNGRDIAIIDHSVKARWARGIGPRKRLPMLEAHA